jgi:predicted MFS family arabinose efflux permease
MNSQLLRVTAGHVCMHGAMSGFRVGAPLLALQQGHSAFEVGLLFSLFGLSQIFLALHAGNLADRVGFKRIVMGAVLVCVASLGLPAVFPRYEALCVAALGTGGAVGYALVALQRHAGRMASGPEELKAAFSWLGVGPAVANFIGPVLAGYLIDHFGFRTAFAVLAAVPLAAWVLVRGIAPEAAKPLDTGQSAANPADVTAWQMLTTPAFAKLLAFNWVMAACWDVHSFMVPILGHEFGFSASTIGSVVGCFALAATGIRLLLPSFAGRLVEWKVMAGVSAGAGLILAAYPFLQHPVLMGMGSLALGVVLGMVQPMMLSTLHQITPAHRHGMALGLRMAITNVASVLMPLGFGAAGAALGTKAVFWSMATLGLIASPFAKKLAIEPAAQPHEALPPKI